MESVVDSETLIALLWKQVELKTRLPDDYTDFFAQHGPTRGRYSSRRLFHRFHFRVKAILDRDGILLGVYTKDLSRHGVGLLSPMELCIGDKVRLRLPNGSNYMLEIVRCASIDDRCFDCGGRFVRGPRKASG